MKSSCLYSVDMGGTYLKACVVNQNHEIVFNQIVQVKADSAGSFDVIKSNYVELLKELNDIAFRANLEPKAMVVSSPGPVDFKNGIPLMKHKYTAIYGVNLKDLFHELGFKGEIEFLSDGIAFFESVNRFNKEKKNAIGITLGTGLGYVLQENGTIKRDELGSSFYKLYNLPFEDGTYEDYFSARGLIKHYSMISGKEIDRSAHIFVLAENGDKDAIDAFDYFGKHFGEALLPIIKEHKIENLYLGGQVSKSSKYFLPALQSVLKDVKIVVEADSDITLTGISYLMEY